MRRVGKKLGEALRVRLCEMVGERGLDVIDPDGENRRWVYEQLEKVHDCQPYRSRPADVVVDTIYWGLPHQMLKLAGKIPGPVLFGQLMLLLLHNRLSYSEAAWVLGAWARALKDHMPETGLRIGQKGQDRAMYLALKKPIHPPLERIEARVTERFGVKLAKDKVLRRKPGQRHLGGGWILSYSFGRGEDGREYLNWEHGHRMTNSTYGRIYEDGEEVDLGASNF